MDFGKDWDAKDTGLALAALLGHAADWDSTKDFLREKRGEEKNPILGKNPSASDIDRYFALTGALGSAGAAMLPAKLRRPLMGAYAGFSGALANQNTKLRAGKDSGPALEKPLMMAALGYGLGALMDDSDAVQLKPEQGGISILFKREF